jgi:zinc/manganese transport system substrate-binding protein
MRLMRPAAALTLVVAALALSGCGEGGASALGLPQVVAAENMWGSIAAQVAGGDAQVQSIIDNPAQDPHSYEPTASDARTLATAQLVIENGAGYDPWAARLVAANPQSGRRVLDVGKLSHVASGGNPHRWYDPSDVVEVARAIAVDLEGLDPGHRAAYARHLAAFEHRSLASYHHWIATIKARYSGVAVGASESIFALLAPALGLDLRTPRGFMKATSEGTEVSARDTATATAQIAQHGIKVWIFNSQNATPQILRLNALARRAHIPIATITETLTPPRASFEQWQVAQLQALAGALHEATGR